MGQISDYTEAPFQGVSQAPPTIRLKTQAEELTDALVVIPEGDIKRPPVTWKKLLLEDVARTDPLFQYVEKQGGADRLVLVNTESSVNELYVFDTNGDADTVVISSEAQDYLDANGAVPRDNLRLLNIADTTFFVNDTVTVQDGADVVPAAPFQALILVRVGAFGRTYSVTVNGSTRSFTLPDGSNANQSPCGDTSYIADVLMGASPSGNCASGGGAASGTGLSSLGGSFTVSRRGPVILIENTSDFDISTEDGAGGSNMILNKGVASGLADLPKTGFDGVYMRIGKLASKDRSDYFLRFNSPNDDGTGIWEETIEPGTNLGIDPELMPIVMVPGSDWSVDVGDWAGRTVGNADLNSDPAFVGTKITDLSFWRGRLAIISKDNVSLSDAIDPFNFYSTTLVTEKDSDPISLASPYNKASTFLRAKPFERKLLVFSDLAVFQVTSDGVLSPGTAEIDLFTETPFDPRITPYAVGRFAYFTAARGTGAQAVYELDTESISDNVEADDSTVVIPRYIPSGIDRSASIPTEFMAYFGKSAGREIIVHMFRRAKNEDGTIGQRLQNAFMKWTLPVGFELAGLAAKGTQIYMLAKVGADYHLGVCDVTPALIDDDAAATMLTHLDWRVKDTDLAAPVYNAVTNRTSFTLPYTPGDPDAVRVVVRAPGGEGGVEFNGALPEVFEGEVVEIFDVDGADVELVGDWRSASLWFGLAYQWRSKLSRLYARDANNRPILTGRLGIRRILFDLARTGFMKAVVTIKGRAARNYTFEGYTYDDPSTLTDQPPDATRTFSVPVHGENSQVDILLTNDTHFPTKLLGFNWFGELNEKARRTS